MSKSQFVPAFEETGKDMKKQFAISLLAALTLVLTACGGGSSPNSKITGIVWQWTAMQETVPASQSVVPDPENYTITFNDDGTYTLKADCNQGSGNYTMDGSSLTIGPGALTRAFCGEDSLDVIYLSSLDKVNSFAVEDGQLQLIFADNGGKMDFNNGGAAQ